MHKTKAVLLMTLLVSVFMFFSPTLSANNLYKNFEAAYSFEFSGMTVAKGKLYGKVDNNTYRIYFSGSTTPFISIFYKLKETIDGTIPINKNTGDILYKSVEKRPKKIKIIQAVFPNTHTANVTITKNKERKTYLLKSNRDIFSPISLYAFFMLNTMKIGKTYLRDVVVTKHLYKVAITPLKKTTINLDKLDRKKGERDTLEVELKFYKIEKDGKVAKYKKVKRVIAWISTTPPFIPILVKSWNFIGLFSVRLTNLKPM